MVKRKIFIFAGIAGGLLFVYFSGQQLFFKEKPIEKFLAQQFPEGYESKTVKIDNLTVGCVYSGGGLESGQTDTFGIVFAEGKGSQFYKVDLEPGFVANSQCQLIDIDGDGNDEILTEWQANAGGSGTNQGLVIWEVDKNQNIVPLTGYPESWESKNRISTIDIKNKETMTFPVTSAYFLTDIITSDQDLTKLYFAKYIWAENETHFGPHFWNLEVYQFKNGSFIRDKSWNNGETYRTREKLPVEENIYSKIRQLFLDVE